MDYSKENRIRYTVEDVCAMEDHAELVDNTLVVIDRTSVAHNNAVVAITSALEQFIRENDGNCRVFSENVALYCDELCDGEGNLFLPDVMVVCDEAGIKDDGVHAAPDFVAEITSESTKKNDYGKKMVVYGDIGVQENWIVDLQRNMVVRYLSDNGFIPEIIYPYMTTLSVHTYPGLDIDPKRIFG